MKLAQTSLFGEAVPTNRLFFALYLTPIATAAAAGISAAVKSAHGLGGAAVAAERLHITLNHLGDYAGLPPNRVAAAIRAGDAIRHAPFEVSFDRLAHFHEKAVVLRGSDEALAPLIAFQRLLAASMSREGLQKLVDKRYTPHVTLVYDRQPVEPQSVDTVRWQVTEFVLVDSWLGKTHHEILARWPLRG